MSRASLRPISPTARPSSSQRASRRRHWTGVRPCEAFAGGRGGDAWVAWRNDQRDPTGGVWLALKAGVVASLLVPGGVLTVLLNQSGTGGTEYQLATSGLALVVLAVVYPSGISGAMGRLGRRRHPVRATGRVVARAEGGGGEHGGTP